MPVKRKTYTRYNISENGPNPVDVHVGQKLRARRTLVGMTQQDLAEATKITFQQIQKYETGKNRTSASRLFQFARVLDTPVDYFFEDLIVPDTKIGIHPGFADGGQESFDSSSSGQEDVMQRKETINLVRAYYDIEDERLRKDFLKMLKQMGKSSRETQPENKKAAK